ncbi:hypothetical protein ACIRSJ_12395 [Streptomyces virginiae]|uniref:hypothetical protein n=1 Tax=Streptomyces virginiae TaxID=1961 RepID=UPI003808102E
MSTHVRARHPGESVPLPWRGALLPVRGDRSPGRSGTGPLDLTSTGINKPVQVGVPADKDVHSLDDNG